MGKAARYFFTRIYELLNHKTFDSYRVTVHNPVTIFIELQSCIDKYDKKRIKNFDPTITSIGEEAYNHLCSEYLDDVYSFGHFSKNQIKSLLKQTCIKAKSDKKTKSLNIISKNIAYHNRDFKNKLILKLQTLIAAANTVQYMNQIDCYCGWLISQLSYEGYSRKYTKDWFHKVENMINIGSRQDPFQKLLDVFSGSRTGYKVLFKIKLSRRYNFNLSSESIEEVDVFPAEYLSNSYINSKFKEKNRNEFYYLINVENVDFRSALSAAYLIIAEAVNVNLLSSFDNKVKIENKALVINGQTNQVRFEPTADLVDGYYGSDADKFERFIRNFKLLPDGTVAKEKIKSALRFYILGNEAVEMEHKILNYWIGFEQLFASVETEENSIARIKAFFSALNSVYYIQRRFRYLQQSLQRCGFEINIDNYTEFTADFPAKDVLYDLRFEKYKNWLVDKKMIHNTLTKHQEKLCQHITRIYRVRNEIVHEGRTESISLPLIVSHLRHYLLFSIENITNDLGEHSMLSHLDDVFAYYENVLERLYEAQNIIEIVNIKPYNGFME